MIKKTTKQPGDNIDDRRDHEAKGLRELFASQWRYFLTILESGNGKPDEITQDPSLISDAIETVIDGTDKRIRAIGSYKKRLRDTVHMTLDYIDATVASIPKAIRVDKDSFSHNPEINALFVNMDDIRNIFSASHELQNFFRKAGHASCDEAYVILFISRNEKTVLGKIIQDDLLVSEVKQTAVNFSNHEIVAVSDSEEGVRRGLKEFIFNHIVKYVSAHMQHIRQQQREQIDRGHMEICISGVSNPEVYLTELINQLTTPGPLLSHKKVQLRLSKLGIKVDENSSETVNKFTAHEFQIGKQPPRVVTIVRYPREDMLTNTALF
ncbi:MAG: hypothetical protein GXP11_03360 [Gammaproteobacteria bacterium]|nr:hypothetical protein [Gammaproteobacteria bacterium]